MQIHVFKKNKKSKFQRMLKAQKRRFNKKIDRLKGYAAANTYRAVKLEDFFTDFLLEARFLSLERQVVLKKYIVDYLIRDKLLVVELYENHHSKTVKYDEKRIREIQGWGFKTLILHENDIYANPSACIDRIKQYESSEENYLTSIALESKLNEFKTGCQKGCGGMGIKERSQKFREVVLRQLSALEGRQENL
jgi:very-short-patch-repair endonuclease